jgi:hypothetical protein
MLKQAAVSLTAPPRASSAKSSFETPCSTLYASPAKIRSDFFCAFQPKRATVPSLPERFRTPLMPSDALLGPPVRGALRSASSVCSCVLDEAGAEGRRRDAEDAVVGGDLRVDVRLQKPERHVRSIFIGADYRR